MQGPVGACCGAYASFGQHEEVLKKTGRHVTILTSVGEFALAWLQGQGIQQGVPGTEWV